MTAGGLRIGEVADAVGVDVETLRYYERRGLLPDPARTLGGHRRYPPEAVTVLRVVKAAQRLGFRLDEVAELLGSGRRRRGRSGLQARAQEKLVEIDRRIADLRAVHDDLAAVLDAGCEDLHECAARECCPIPFAPRGIEAAPPSDEVRRATA